MAPARHEVKLTCATYSSSIRFRRPTTAWMCESRRATAFQTEKNYKGPGAH